MLMFQFDCFTYFLSNNKGTMKIAFQFSLIFRRSQSALLFFFLLLWDSRMRIVYKSLDRSVLTLHTTKAYAVFFWLLLFCCTTFFLCHCESNTFECRECVMKTKEKTFDKLHESKLHIGDQSLSVTSNWANPINGRFKFSRFKRLCNTIWNLVRNFNELAKFFVEYLCSIFNEGSIWIFQMAIYFNKIYRVGYY